MRICKLKRSYFSVLKVLCVIGIGIIFINVVHEATFFTPNNEVLQKLHNSVNNKKQRRVLVTGEPDLELEEDENYLKNVPEEENIANNAAQRSWNSSKDGDDANYEEHNPEEWLIMPKRNLPPSTTPETTTNKHELTSPTRRTKHVKVSTPTTEDPTCPKIKSIFYLKVHKTASTSVKNVLDRFALNHYLKPLLFLNVDTFPDKDLLKHLVPIKSYLQLANEESIENILLNENLMKNLKNRIIEENKCDIIDTHTVFNETVARKLLRGQPKFLASIRHPLAQLKSAANHFSLYEKLGLQSFTDPLEEFLKDPKKYDKHLEFYFHPEYRISYTKNFIAYTFGFDTERENDTAYVKEFLSYINKTFDYVIIAEDFVSSMVVLKNKLCWNFREILFLEHREQIYASKRKEVSGEGQRSHMNWSSVDYQLYDMFVEKHKHEVEALGKKFWHDMYILNHLAREVWQFCRKVCLRLKIITDHIQSLGLQDPNPMFDQMFDELLGRNITVRAIDNFVATIDGDDCMTMSIYDHYMEWVVLARHYPELCDQNNVNLLSDLGVVILSKVNCPSPGGKTLRNGIPYEIFQDSKSVLTC